MWGRRIRLMTKSNGKVIGSNSHLAPELTTYEERTGEAKLQYSEKMPSAGDSMRLDALTVRLSGSYKERRLKNER